MAITAYVTVAQADVYLLNEADTFAWDLLSDPAKQVALDYGRAYLDQSYTCTIADVTDEVILHANSLLGNEYAKDTLFTAVDNGLKKKKVSATSGTSTEKEYDLGMKNEDKFLKITSLLSSICVLNSQTISVPFERVN